ncbi:MAG: TonB-dependent receptor [Rhizobiales bacterium]|nr:TonB-dependent receptor [Hyphomicrobiales bacterium]
MNSAIIIVGEEARSPASRTVLKATTLALFLSTAPAALDAAYAQQGNSNWLDEITVVGTRTEVSVQDNPASVSVIDQEKLQRQAPESIAEMLRDVPGVEVIDSSAAGMKRIRIRGESSRRVTILVDGQEITDHSTYGTPILVDPSNVERIDVVRGPASVLYGAKAIGGVVNIITKRGADKPIQLETGGAYYSGTAGWQGWAAVSGTLDKFDYRLSGAMSDHGDRRVPVGQYTSTGTLDGTSFSNDNLSAHLGYKFGENGNHYIALKAEQHRLKTESWTDPATLTYPITDFKIDLPKRDLRKVGVYYDGTDLSPVVRKVHIDAYHQTVDRLFRNDVVMKPLANTTVGVVSTSDDTNTNYGGTAQVDLQFHPDHYTIVGVNYLTDNLLTAKTSTTSSKIGAAPLRITPSSSFDDASINTFSTFVQDQWSFAEHFKLIAGMRYYHTETVLDRTTTAARAGLGTDNDDRVVTSAGITYTGIANTTLRTMYSEGYITPTLLQLFTDSSAGRGVLTYGNPNLAPETSRNVEVGARYNAGGLVLDTAVFYTKAKDYITSVPCTAGAGCPTGAPVANFIYANADGADTYGLEAIAQYTIPNTHLTPYATGAWMRRKLEFKTWSTYDSDTPALAGRLGMRWEGHMAEAPVWTDLFVRASSGVKLASMDSGVLSVRSLSSWGTLNFAFGGSFGEGGRLRLGVQFNNILNQEYRSTFDELPGIGRSVELTARMTF